MDFTTMSVEKLCEFLRGRTVPGTALAFPKEVATKIRDNCIDGATLLILMEDLAELREVIPNTAHRVQLKRIVLNARNDSTSEDSNRVVIQTIQTTDEEKDTVVVLPETSNAKQPLTPVHNHMTNNSLSQSPTIVKPYQTSTPVSSNKSHDKDEISQGLPSILPTPERLSIRVEEAISRNDLLTVRLQLIKDAGNFYYGLCRHPKQGDYGRMAKKLCERFPELKDVNGDHYWMSVQKQLSMFFRNQRRLSKKPKGKENAPEQATTSTAKKIRLEDDSLTSKRNLDLLKNTKKSDFSTATYGKLVEETYKRRREYIKHDAESVKDILQQCPYLSDPCQVKKEVAKLIGMEKVVGATDRILAGLQAVLKVCGDLSGKQITDAVSEIQRRTKKRKVPGKLISFHDPSTPAAKMFCSKMQEFRIVCVGTPTDVAQIFILCEDDVVYECLTTSLLEALFNVIACYYVFDVGYPASLEGILFFLQDVGLLCADANSARCSKYNSLLAELKDFTKK